MSDVRRVVLDNEAVQALASVRHPKHRRALAIVEATAGRNLRRAGAIRLVVPTAVRVEAGWDRQKRSAAAINRLRFDESPLDREAADRAAPVAAGLGISVADAHIAAVLTTTPGPHAVVTSDAADMGRLAGHLAVPVAVVRV